MHNRMTSKNNIFSNDYDENKYLYLKYKTKYLELKKQIGGLTQVTEEIINGCKIKKFVNNYFGYFDTNMLDKNIQPDGSMKIRILQDNTQIIGSGGYGKIILVRPRVDTGLEQFVIKLIYKRQDCSNAEIEFNNIIQVSDAFDDFRALIYSRETPETLEFRNLLNYLNPLKTYGYYNCEIEYNLEMYKCCILTSYSQGYDVNSVIIPNLLQSYNEEDKQILRDNYQNILIMPLCIDGFPRIKIDSRSNSEHLSNSNPIRYAKLSVDRFGPLNIIRQPDYLESYGKIMGMLQAILLLIAKISTTDLEILTGPDGDSYVYNLIDYGMLEPIRINEPINTKDSIDYIVNKITDPGSVFMAKPSFPSQLGPIFTDFIEYLKKTCRFIRPELDEEFFNEFIKTIKEELYL